MSNKLQTNAEVADQLTDAEVAERVLGWRIDEHEIWHTPRRRGIMSHGIKLPRYTTDASAAEQVVVAMAKRGYWLELYSHFEDEEMLWGVNFRKGRDGLIAGYAEGTGPTSALFICRAALDAMGDDNDE